VDFLTGVAGIGKIPVIGLSRERRTAAAKINTVNTRNICNKIFDI
jgi:hypothetical protein